MVKLQPLLPGVTEFENYPRMGRTHLALYEELLDAPDGLSLAELEAAIFLPHQGNLSRRLREMRAYLDIPYANGRYKLVGRSTKEKGLASLSLRIRADVLAAGYCFMCGRVPAHGIVLKVDHIVPLDLGGTDERANLQPLCEDCNLGKKNHTYRNVPVLDWLIRKLVQLRNRLR